MTPQNMYYSVVYHWDDIYCAYRDGNVVEIHGRRIFLKSGIIIYYDNRGCVYCGEFSSRDEPPFINEDCVDCPIKNTTGKNSCYASPWYTFDKNPSAINALKMREFVRCHPPEGVEILHWLPN